MVRLAAMVPAPLKPIARRLRRSLFPVNLPRTDHLLLNPLAAIHSLTPPVAVERDANFTIKVHLRNEGTEAWSPLGTCPVSLRADWRTSRKANTNLRAFSMDLPHPLAPGEACEITATAKAPVAIGQYLLEIKPVQAGGPAFDYRKPAWIDVNVLAPTAEEIDYYKVYATADLEKDYWTVVGPPTQAEFHRLADVKRGQLIEQGLTPDSHVLDVGCGTGQLACGLENYLSDRGLYFGTDVGEEAIAFCKKKYPRPNFRFAVNDFTSIPVGEHRFDLACYFSVFTHTYPDETALLLAETAKRLRPGGAIIGDLFTSPTTDRCAGNRGAVEVNREHFARLVALCGLKMETVSSWAWKDHARREVMRFTAV